MLFKDLFIGSKMGGGGGGGGGWGVVKFHTDMLSPLIQIL